MTSKVARLAPGRRRDVPDRDAVERGLGRGPRAAHRHRVGAAGVDVEHAAGGPFGVPGGAGNVVVVLGGRVVVGAVDDVDDDRAGLRVVAVEVVDEPAAERPLDDGVEDEPRIDTAMKPISTTIRATPAPVSAQGSHERAPPRRAAAVAVAGTGRRRSGRPPPGRRRGRRGRPRRCHPSRRTTRATSRPATTAGAATAVRIRGRSGRRPSDAGRGERRGCGLGDRRGRQLGGGQLPAGSGRRDGGAGAEEVRAAEAGARGGAGGRRGRRDVGMRGASTRSRSGRPTSAGRPARWDRRTSLVERRSCHLRRRGAARHESRMAR